MQTESLINENGDNCLQNCFSKLIEGNTKGLTFVDRKAVNETAKQLQL